MKFVKANALGFYVFFIFLSLDVMAAEQFIPELTRSNAPYDLDAVRDIAKNIDRESMTLGLPEPTNVMTFTNFGMKDIYYALYEEPLIRLFSMNGNKYINGWTLQHVGWAECAKPNVYRAANGFYQLTMLLVKPNITARPWHLT